MPTVRVPPVASLRFTLLAASLFAFASAAVRLLAGTHLYMDDAKTNVFTQAWRWGYQPDNPPLFEWLVILLHGPFGGAWSFLVLRACLLVGAAAFTHLAVRRWAGEGAATGAALGMALLYQVGWNYHQAFTHSALLLFATAFALWAGLRYVNRPALGSAALFGAALGIGFLSKYNFVLFAVPFLIAASTLPRSRRSVFSLYLLLSLLIAAVLVAPHLAWLADRGEAYGAAVRGSLALEGGRAERTVGGLGELIAACLTFFLPWALVAGWLGRRGGLTWTLEERLLLRTSLLAFAAMAAGVLLLGIGSISERYVIPGLLPAYVALSAGLLRSRPTALRPLLIASGAVAALFTAVRLATLAVMGPPFCGECQEGVPYGALTELVAKATPPSSVLVAWDEQTAGNLVAVFPEAEVRGLTLLPMINPTSGDGRPCFLVWSTAQAEGARLGPVFGYAYDHPQTVQLFAPWRHPFQKDGWRQTDWAVTPIEGPLYERFCTP